MKLKFSKIVVFLFLLSGIFIFPRNTQAQPWIAQNSGGSTNLNAIFFPVADTGYAVGVDGLVLATSDGGLTWVRQNLGSSVPVLFSTFFVGVDSGYMVGANGVVFKTGNGGKSWLPRNSNVSGNLYDVHFASGKSGWIAGDNGIFHSSDGGETWSLQSTQSLRSIHFQKSDIGYAVGSGGVILKFSLPVASLKAKTGLRGFHFEKFALNGRLVFCFNERGNLPLKAVIWNGPGPNRYTKAGL